MKTILKLYPNGNFETINTALIQSEIPGNYKFTENSITVPKIIEYPPEGYRNYFIEKTSVGGWVTRWEEDNIPAGELHTQNEHDRTSDFINVSDWTSTTIRVRFRGMSNQYRAWVSVLYYDNLKKFLISGFDSYVGPEQSVGDYMLELKIPANASFLRISTNYYDNPDVTVKISVEKGNTTNTKHYLAHEDLPLWVKDTGQPISIFSEGIVLKGDLIQTDS